MRIPGIILGILVGSSVFSVHTDVSAQSHAPTMDQIISLRWTQSPVISPDGSRVAYHVRETNWEENAYETEIWLVDVATAAARQLTNANGSSRAAAWSPDGTSIAFLSDREEKT